MPAGATRVMATGGADAWISPVGPVRLDLASAALSMTSVLALIYGLKHLAAGGGIAVAVPAVVAGLLLGHRIVKGQRGSRAFMTLDDRTGRVEVTVFSDLLEQVRPLLRALA